MEKITVQELENRIKSKLLEKGASEDDINEELLKSITERIKTEVNSGIVCNEQPEEEVVDIATQESLPQDLPGEEPEAITSSVETNPESEEVYKKEGELEARERQLLEKENELKRKEEELRRKEEEMEYKPSIPEAIKDMGSEKLFVFDKNQISVGAEKLSQTEMSLVGNPEEKTTMQSLWVNDGKKDAEVFVVKFEKIGDIIFDPFEGASDFQYSSQESEESKEATFEDSKEEMQSNMRDSIEPIKDITQPMTNDMGLNVNGDKMVDLENMPKHEYDDVLNSKVEDFIKKYLHGHIALQKNND